MPSGNKLVDILHRMDMKFANKFNGTLLCWHAGQLQLLEWKRGRIRAKFNFDKEDIPVLRRDLSRIKLSKSAWDRVHSTQTHG
eukprot:715487-Pelagomonas_calceolata.AAC.1